MKEAWVPVTWCPSSQPDIGQAAEGEILAEDPRAVTTWSPSLPLQPEFAPGRGSTSTFPHQHTLPAFTYVQTHTGAHMHMPTHAPASPHPRLFLHTPMKTLTPHPPPTCFLSPIRNICSHTCSSPDVPPWVGPLHPFAHLCALKPLTPPQLPSPDTPSSSPLTFPQEGFLPCFPVPEPQKCDEA